MASGKTETLLKEKVVGTDEDNVVSVATQNTTFWHKER